jgi:diaminopimelate epimerase
MTEFYKFHGAGNDFIMLDGRNLNFEPTKNTIAGMCHRHLGIGADGLIIVARKDGFDFEMIYFNSDGSPAEMCGNGARCASAFASMLGIAGDEVSFMAGDGPHKGLVKRISDTEWIVEISMRDVAQPENYGERTEINTGTPHFVVIVPEVKAIDTLAEGRSIRYSPEYTEKGINVDWVSFHENLLHVRTYERGVEAETLSCGTGVTACAMIAGLTTGKTAWEIDTPGGRLAVRYRLTSGHFTDVKLQGPVKLAFKGAADLTAW